jgi:hypothetical protein
MSHSRTTLNAPFYEWIDEVRRAFRKEKELLGKLEYCNVKFIGYKGINYGQIITNLMPRNDKDMLYWLDKIDETEWKLVNVRKIILEHNELKKVVCNKDSIIIDFLIEDNTSLESLLLLLNMSKKQYYKRISKLSKIIAITSKKER